MKVRIFSETERDEMVWTVSDVLPKPGEQLQVQVRVPLDEGETRTIAQGEKRKRIPCEVTSIEWFANPDYMWVQINVIELDEEDSD